jgi:hypothetical protein
MTNLELLKYFSEVARRQVLMPDWPLGKLYASVLDEQHPDLATQIRGDVDLDPYLHDDNISEFTVWMLGKGHNG